MNSVSNIIEVHHLSFQYNCTNVFQNLHFELQTHKFVGLFGANGSGKSTFLRLILGELKCFSGSIHLFGQSVSKFRTWHKIGYVPQIGLTKQMDFPATVKEVVQANLYSSLGLFRFPGKKRGRKSGKNTFTFAYGRFQQSLNRRIIRRTKTKGVVSPCTGIESQSLDFR